MTAHAAPPYARTRGSDAKHRTGHATLTGSTDTQGRVSGHLLQRVRTSLGVTQDGLAERAGVGQATVQGWESGRRPLTALHTPALLRLYGVLTAAGAPPNVGRLFADALEADVVIGSAVTAGATPLPAHPLGAGVARRALTEMVTWPLSGVVPPAVAALPQPLRRTPAAPVLHAGERDRLCDHLLTAADAATGDGGVLLRRQAVYLLSFDPRASTAEWLTREQRRTLTRSGSWASTRSAAVALAQRGDPEPLAAFVANIGRDETAELANLTYFAYWVGELPQQADDGFMVSTAVDEWGGARLLAHLLSRTVPDSPCLTLNAHSLWSLVTRRPALLAHHPRLRVATAQHVAGLLDHALPATTRRELASVAHAAHDR